MIDELIKEFIKKVVYRQIPHERSEWYFYRQIIPVSYSDTKIDRTHSSGESSMQDIRFIRVDFPHKKIPKHE